MAYLIASQRSAPNSPQWFNTGLNWAYGITGPAQGHHYVDAVTGELKLSEDAYTHPQPHACFIQSVGDSLVGELNRLWAYGIERLYYSSMDRGPVRTSPR